MKTKQEEKGCEARNEPGPVARVVRQALGHAFRLLPLGMRRTIRGLRLQYLISAGVFDSDEPEYLRLAEWLEPGDIAMDVGANFGSYSVKMSRLVGDAGRVIAFEPVPQTFAMLVRSLAASGCSNVSALNIACSNANGLVTMSIPDDPVSGENLYQASISRSGPSLITVLCARIDDLPLPIDDLKLVKIDAEGHDAEVIEGMWSVISRVMPVLIAEHPSKAISERLTGLGYVHTHQAGSPNGVFIPPRFHYPRSVQSVELADPLR